MRKSTWKQSLVLAGVLGAGALALPLQASAANDTSDVPLHAGEASTITNGVPNLLPSNARYANTVVLLTPVAMPAVVTQPDASAAITQPDMSAGVTSDQPVVVTLIPVTPQVINGDRVLVLTQ